MESVLAQHAVRGGGCEIEYLVFDGASTDGTLELLRSYEARGVRVVSEPDAGFYAALAKGLQRTTGDCVAYLNAGDVLHPGALSIALECFRLPGVQWLTGYTAVCNERSQITHCGLPYRYRRNLFECGAYGTFLPFLQQESTVWRRTLHSTVDFGYLAKLRYAGDAYLWKCFAGVCDLYIVAGLIGSFRVHQGQISERKDHYRQELASFSRHPSPWERVQGLLDRALWAAPERVKATANPATLVFYDHGRQSWAGGRRDG